MTGPAEADLVRSLGADEVIDRGAADFTSRPDTYHVIFDAESESSFARCRGSLTSDGYLLAVTRPPVSEADALDLDHVVEVAGP